VVGHAGRAYHGVVKVTVRYFAVVRERLGLESELFALHEGARVADLRVALLKRRPALADMLPHVRLAVDQDFAADNLPLRDGAEVALIPPVSGGSDAPEEGRAGAAARVAPRPPLPPPLLRLQEAPLEIEPVVGAVAGQDAGAVDVFVGTVRATSRGREVEALEYEAYTPMAEAQLARFAGEVAAQWPGTRVAVVHRTGRLRVGERSVVIAVASPHRADAFAACRHVIERLKQDAPIWKREVYRDGAIWVGWGS
jgi:molybdopterin converting factor subunit 1